MGAIENEHIYAIQVRESANDGSDFSNADADYRIAFIGEDGVWHLKDSSGTVTTPGGSTDLDAIITASSGQDIADALAGAAAPDSGNVFATMADVGGGGSLDSASVTRSSGSLALTNSSFASVDAAFELAITTGAHRVMIGVTGSWYTNGVGSGLLDVDLDGTRLGAATNGMIRTDSGNDSPMAINWLTDALSAGSHTFKLQARITSGGTLNIRADNTNAKLHFWVAETSLT